MPVHKVKDGFRWGKTGKVYKTKAAAERKAKQQADSAERKAKREAERKEKAEAKEAARSLRSSRRRSRQVSSASMARISCRRRWAPLSSGLSCVTCWTG